MQRPRRQQQFTTLNPPEKYIQHPKHDMDRSNRHNSPTPSTHTANLLKCETRLRLVPEKAIYFLMRFRQPDIQMGFPLRARELYIFVGGENSIVKRVHADAFRRHANG